MACIDAALLASANRDRILPNPLESAAKKCILYVFSRFPRQLLRTPPTTDFLFYPTSILCRLFNQVSSPCDCYTSASTKHAIAKDSAHFCLHISFFIASFANSTSLSYLHAAGVERGHDNGSLAPDRRCITIIISFRGVRRCQQ